MENDVSFESDGFRLKVKFEYESFLKTRSMIGFIQLIAEFFLFPRPIQIPTLRFRLVYIARL